MIRSASFFKQPIARIYYHWHLTICELILIYDFVELLYYNIIN